MDVWHLTDVRWGCFGAKMTCICRRFMITSDLKVLVVFIVIDHDTQHIERILTFVEKREEVLLLLGCFG